MLVKKRGMVLLSALEMERKQKRIQHRAVGILLSAALFLFVISIVAIGIGSVYIPPSQVIAVLSGQVEPGATEYIIIYNMRFTRILGSMAGGAALALAGLLMQILFGNPIADPYILGISSGARMVVGIVLLGGITLQLPFTDSPWFLFCGAFLGALLVMGIMLLFANRFHNITMVLIAGMMVGYFCNAIVNTLVAFSNDNQIADFTRWNLGSFGLLSWQKLTVLVVVCLFMFAAAGLLSKNLNLMRMGEAYAQTMGVDTKKLRLFIIIISGILTAVVTAFCGLISFVGMSVPHISRLLLCTTDNRILIPGVMILGGIFGVFCDLLARVIAAPGELPVGIITSFVGVPLVLYLLCQEQGGKRW